MKPLLDLYNSTSGHPQELDLSTMNRIIKESDIVFAPNGAAMCNLLFVTTQSKMVGIVYPSSHLDAYHFLVSNSLSFDFFTLYSDSCATWDKLEDMIKPYYYLHVSDDYTVNPNIIDNMLASLSSVAN